MLTLETAVVDLEAQEALVALVVPDSRLVQSLLKLVVFMYTSANIARLQTGKPTGPGSPFPTGSPIPPRQ